MLNLICKHKDFERYGENYTPSKTIFLEIYKMQNGVEIDDSKSGG